MKNVIETKDLSKQYSDVKAVSDLDLHVGKGEIYGFLGLNGAGKTTTIRMLLGMISPTSGSAFIKGRKVRANHHDLWKKTGHMVEVPYSYPNLTVKENLEIICRLRLMKDKNAIDRVITQLRLEPYQNRKAKNLSQGNAQRLGLAKTLMHNPEVLILDEPTNGLDPAGIFEVRKMLIELAKNQGISIFISSHILGEMAKIATRIGIIHQGCLIQEIYTNELETLCERQLQIRTQHLRTASKILKKHYQNIEILDNKLIVKDQKAINHPEEAAKLLVNEDCPPYHLQVEEENLESYFLRTIDKQN